MTAAPTTPFGIATGQPETTRRLRALRMGEAYGLWTILPSRNPADPPNQIIFRVRLTGGDTVRHLAAAEVLTWCLGVADAYGVGDDFTYREGL